MSIDKDVVALEISMNYWRIIAMQINKTTKDLACPVLNGTDVYPRVFLSIPVIWKIE